VRYFNWHKPEWEDDFQQYHNPDHGDGDGSRDGPTPRPLGVVEKCTFCIHRLLKARAKAEQENRAFRPDEYVPACVQTCTGKARFFGDLDDPDSTVSQLAKNPRAFRLLEDVGTHPKVIYLQEG
jgi:molybdopterin-containing oxidoreductase family iron-sulfur binding subunit